MKNNLNNKQFTKMEYSSFINGLQIYFTSRSSQCSTTGVTKVVVCVILSVGIYLVFKIYIMQLNKYIYDSIEGLFLYFRAMHVQTSCLWEIIMQSYK